MMMMFSRNPNDFFLKFITFFSAARQRYSLVVKYVNARAELSFRNWFGKYPSFSSAYVVLRPHFFKFFLVVVGLPGTILVFYIFFYFYRIFEADQSNPEFFLVLYGTRVNTFVDYFYLFYRYADTTGFYAYTIFTDLAVQLYFELLTNNTYSSFFSWTPRFVNPQEFYTALWVHVKDTPYPQLGRFPMLEYVKYLITGDLNHYVAWNSTSRYLRDQWYDFFLDLLVTILKTPYYIWVDRSDIHYYYAWKIKVQYCLFEPSLDYFSLFYLDPFRKYFSGWLSFVPSYNFSTLGVVIVYNAVFSLLKTIFGTLINFRVLFMEFSTLLDYLSLYATTPSKLFSFVVTAVYGLPFLFFSYVVVYLSLFFTPLYILASEVGLICLDTLYCFLWPIFTSFEDLFSPDSLISERAKARVLLEVSDAWMWFFPITFVTLLLYLLLLVFASVWLVLYRPIFFVYSLFYDQGGLLRSFETTKFLVVDQVYGINKRWQFKWLLTLEYFDFIRCHTKLALFAVVFRSTDEYLYTFERFMTPLLDQFTKDLKELENWEKRDREACEELTHEQHAQLIDENRRELEAQNIIQGEIQNWSSLGNPPNFNPPYPTVVRFMRFTIKPFAYAWSLIGFIGLASREVYVRLFMDGLAPGVINPSLGYAGAHYMDIPFGPRMDPNLLYDKWMMRWIPFRGGQIFYNPLPMDPGSYTYADLIVVSYRWFFLGFFVTLFVCGVTWLVFGTARELLVMYWVAAFFGYIYYISFVFGDAFGYGITDHLLPFTGFLESWVLHLDGWAVGVGLTDVYEEFKMMCVERSIYLNEFKYQRYEKSGWGWYARRAYIMFGVYYYRNMYPAEFYPHRRRMMFDEVKTQTWMQRLLERAKSDPQRVTQYKRAYLEHVESLYEKVDQALLLFVLRVKRFSFGNFFNWYLQERVESVVKLLRPFIAFLATLDESLDFLLYRARRVIIRLRKYGVQGNDTKDDASDKHDD